MTHIDDGSDPAAEARLDARGVAMLENLQRRGYAVRVRVNRGGFLRFRVIGNGDGLFRQSEYTGLELANKLAILETKEARAVECDARRATGEQTFRCGYCRRTRKDAASATDRLREQVANVRLMTAELRHRQPVNPFDGASGHFAPETVSEISIRIHGLVMECAAIPDTFENAMRRHDLKGRIAALWARRARLEREGQSS